MPSVSASHGHAIMHKAGNSPLAARVAAGEAVSYRDKGDLQALPENEMSIDTRVSESSLQTTAPAICALRVH
jgi:hypothetical protein